MDNRPIGVFDSGYGGLTSVKALKKILPDENIVFYGDNGRAPYGVRTGEQLMQFVSEDIDFLRGFGIKALIVACGTAYAAGHSIIDATEFPSTGVIAPAVKKLAKLGTGGKPVGIIATGFSVKSRMYETLIEEAMPGTETVAVGCPDFVTLVEAGRTSKDDPAVRDACERYLAPIREAGAGTLILGCTHFGLLSDAITAYLGNDVVLLEASACAAEYMAEYLKEHDMLGTGGNRRFFTSGNAEIFDATAPIFLEDSEKLNTVHAEAGKAE